MGFVGSVSQTIALTTSPYPELSDSVTFSSHGLAVAAEGKMDPRALQYDGATFSFANTVQNPIEVWGIAVGVVDSDTLLVHSRASSWGRRYNVSGLAATLSASPGESIYLQTDGSNGTTKTHFRMYQIDMLTTDEFVMFPLLLGTTTVAIAGESRKRGADNLGSITGAQAVNFDLGDFDNKECVLTGDTQFTLSGTKSGRYTIVIDNTGGHAVTWTPALDGPDPVITGIAVANFTYAVISDTWHSREVS